jgi:hypothetical protein
LWILGGDLAGGSRLACVVIRKVKAQNPPGGNLLSLALPGLVRAARFQTWQRLLSHCVV